MLVLNSNVTLFFQLKNLCFFLFNSDKREMQNKPLFHILLFRFCIPDPYFILTVKLLASAWNILWQSKGIPWHVCLSRKQQIYCLEGIFLAQHLMMRGIYRMFIPNTNAITKFPLRHVKCQYFY